MESKPLYKILYLRTAECDFYGIFDYISQDNPKAASSLLEKIDHAIFQLETNPLLGMVPKDERLKIKGYRMLVVEQYLVFYVIRKKTVQKTLDFYHSSKALAPSFEKD